MKEFVKMTLAVMCGLFLMGIVGFFLLISALGSLIAAAGSSSSTVVLPREGVLAMDMSKYSFVEVANPNTDFQALLQGQEIITPVSIWSAVQAVRKAAQDPGVKFLYLKPDGMSIGLAQLQELRAALEEFRASGKAVIAYTETPTTATLWLSSVADKVYLDSYCGTGGMVHGLSTQLIFVKDLLDKLGVNVQLIRHGKYKSAGEMFIRNSASPENLEQNQVLVNSMWKTISTDIAQGRGIETEQQDKSISELKLQFPADFLALNLVDSLTTREQLKQRLAVLSGKESFSEVSLIPFGDYVQAKTGKDNGYHKIAIIYADGEIVEGKDPTNVAGNRFASLIAKVRNDASVEAVVFRVNSPGGSVTASDKIKNEIDLLRAEKPVIASYANYAASGGYWISNSCDKIFSNATTLTGSIGVFGMIPDLSKTMKNIVHVNITPVTTHKHGDMYSLMRPFDKEETAYMQASIEDIYDTFVHTVAEGRDLVPEFVDSVAQGRVWSGSDALGIGLVDELGTLTDALKFAAVKVTGDSDLSSWTIAEYPEPRTTLEMVMEALGEMTPDEEMIFAGTPLEKTAKHVMNWADSWKKSQYGEWAFARMPYEMVIR